MAVNWSERRNARRARLEGTLQVGRHRAESRGQCLAGRYLARQPRGQRPVGVYHGADVLDDQRCDLARVPGGVLIGVHTAQGVAENQHRAEPEMPVESRDVSDVIGPLIALGTFGLTMPTLVQSNHSPLRRQRLSQRGEHRRLG